MRTSSLSLVAGSALLPFAALAEPLYAPSLLFNWTLRNVDAPLQLSRFNLINSNDVNSPAVKESTASADVEFIGTGISYNGQSSGWEANGSDGLPRAAGAAYVTGDATWESNNNQLFRPMSDSVLWSRSTPRFLLYTMSLQAYYGDWTLTSVDVMTGMNSTASSLAEVPTRVEHFVTDQGKLNSFYNLTGRWDVMPASGGLPEQAKCYDDAVLRVAIPPGTAYIAINGTRSTASRNMYFVFTKNGDENDRETAVIDAVFPSSTEALLYMRPLDPSIKYVLIMNCVFTGTYGEQGLTSMTFYEGSAGGGGGKNTTVGVTGPGGNGGNGGNGGGSGGNGNGSTSKLSPGGIAGIVVAAVMLILAGLVIWYCTRRRRTAAPPHSGIQAYQSTGLDGEVDVNVIPTPYQYQPAQPVHDPISVHQSQVVPHLAYEHDANEPPPAYGQQLKY